MGPGNYTVKIPNNTPIYYRIVSVSGNLNISDFDQPATLTGSRNVISGQMNLNISIKNSKVKGQKSNLGRKNIIEVSDLNST